MPVGGIRACLWTLLLNCAAAVATQPMADTVLRNTASHQSRPGNTGAQESSVTGRLVQAVRGGNVSLARLSLRDGADPNTHNDVNGTLLSLAVRHQQVEMVGLLLDAKADPDLGGVFKRRPLHEAAKNGNLKILKLLLRHGANIGVTDEDGVTPLGSAVKWRQAAAVEMLVAAGADLKGAIKGDTFLNHALWRQDAVLAKTLLRLGVRVNAPGQQGYTPLHVAVTVNDAALVKWLLANNANPTVLDDIGNTPLMRAAEAGFAHMVDLLITKQSDIDHRNFYGESALHLSARTDLQTTINLLRAKPDIDARDDKGRTPLIEAVISKQAAVARLLVGRGATLTIKDKMGKNVHHYVRNPSRYPFLNKKK